MEALRLNDSEKRYYGDLFNACDTDNTGKITGVKASDLFIASQLSPETLHQITELCGAKRLGHFGRSQFYVALKLIAVVQSGLPLKLDNNMYSGCDVPLPRFNRYTNQPQILINVLASQPPVKPLSNTTNGTAVRPVQTNNGVCSTNNHPAVESDLIQLQDGGEKRLQKDSCDGKVVFVDSDDDLVQNPAARINSDDQCSQPIVSSPSSTPHFDDPRAVGNHSPSDSYSPTSTPASATTTKKDWMSFSKRSKHHRHHRHNQDEAARGVDGTPGVAGQWEDDHEQLIDNESSELHSSDDEAVADVWTITAEQKAYYVKQFVTMQPNLNGLITGAVARDFFQKSTLLVTELSRIWHLSDVTKDGALSLDEFCTAMHLVVLRRHNIELPDALPAQLVPRVWPQPGEENHTFQENSHLPNAGGTGSQWTGASTGSKFPPAPASPASSAVSSPGGMKPVNFDFNKINLDQDPKILHPVPVRLSPDAHLASSEDETAVASPPHRIISNQDPIPYEPLPQNRSPMAAKRASTGSAKFGGVPFIPPPSAQQANNRSQTRKHNQVNAGDIVNHISDEGTLEAIFSHQQYSSFSGPTSLPTTVAHFAGGTTTVYVGPSTSAGTTVQLGSCKKEPPPPPPPRPRGRNHARSSSLDLNRLSNGSSASFLHLPPAVPPRVSLSTASFNGAMTSSDCVADGGRKMVGLMSEPDMAGLLLNLEGEESEPEGAAVPGDRRDGVLSTGKSGAFEVYRRVPENTEPESLFILPGTRQDQVGDIYHGESGHLMHSDEAVRTKQDILTAMQSLRERNAVLLRVNATLNEELALLAEGKATLGSHLEKIKMDGL